MKNFAKYGLAIGLGFGLLYWVFKDQDFLSALDNFKDANYFLVFIAFLLALLSHICRAYRWNLMLEPMGYKPSLIFTTVAVLIGYFTNLILPRAGEFARSASLQKTEGIPFEKSFGAVVAERVIDVFVALLLVLINIILEFSRIKDLALEMFGQKLNEPIKLVVFLMVTLAIIFIVVKLILKYKERLLKNALIQKLNTILMGLWSGFSSVLKIKRPSLFFFHTFFIWFLYYATTYLLCKALPIGQGLSAIAIFTILVMGSIGMAAPTIGGLGTYHALVSKIVIIYGLTAEQGVNLAFFLHTINSILFLLVFGCGAFLITFFLKSKIKTDAT